MKVKYIVSVDAPQFGQELFADILSATLKSFNLRKTYKAYILDYEIAPKYMRKSKFEFTLPKALPDNLTPTDILQELLEWAKQGQEEIDEIVAKIPECDTASPLYVKLVGKTKVLDDLIIKLRRFLMPTKDKVKKYKRRTK